MARAIRIECGVTFYHVMSRANERRDNLGATLFSATCEYDAVGNRTRMVKDSVQTLYTYDNMNQMLTAGGVSFTYDVNENLISEYEVSGIPPQPLAQSAVLMAIHFGGPEGIRMHMKWTRFSTLC